MQDVSFRRPKERLPAFQCHSRRIRMRQADCGTASRVRRRAHPKRFWRSDRLRRLAELFRQTPAKGSRERHCARVQPCRRSAHGYRQLCA